MLPDSASAADNFAAYEGNGIIAECRYPLLAVSALLITAYRQSGGMFTAKRLRIRRRMDVFTRLVIFTLGLITISVFSTLAASYAFVSSAGMIAFTSDQSGNWDIYLMDVGHSISHNLTHHPADDVDPAWSNVAGRLAFFSDRNGDVNTEIYLMNLDGGDVQPLAIGGDNVGHPSWSADGQQIVFIRNFGNIRFIDVDGTNERGLTYGFGPVWSPTNGEIAYYKEQRGDLNADIYLINEDGSAQRNLTQHPAHDWHPSWSPDGRQLAFVSSRDGNPEIYVMDAACTAPCPAHRLTHNPSADRDAAWSPDGLLIAFESEIDGKSQIFIMSVDGANPRLLNNGLVENRSPVWIDLLDS
jgi:TolB protein